MRHLFLTSGLLALLLLVACGGGGSSTSSTGTGGQGGDKTCDNVPCIGGCPIFPSDNPWNTRIKEPTKFPVHPDWDNFKAQMALATPLHPDWGNWSVDHFGIPWQTVPATQQQVPMSFDNAAESDPGPYPFPPNARVEPGDGHVIVIQLGACVLWETYQSTYVDPGWHCGSGAKFDLNSNALRTECHTSADAAGLPILPGLVKLSEVQAGTINHAIRFTMAKTGAGHIHPATHDAASSTNAWAPPMGLRLRLRKDFDTSNFSNHKPTMAILTALQEYGIILADNGKDWYLTGDSDDGWTADLMDMLGQDLAQVHGSDFEAVYTGDTIPHTACP